MLKGGNDLSKWSSEKQVNSETSPEIQKFGTCEKDSQQRPTTIDFLDDKLKILSSSLGALGFRRTVSLEDMNPSNPCKVNQDLS